jgi:hypothetical protein
MKPNITVASLAFATVFAAGVIAPNESDAKTWTWKAKALDAQTSTAIQGVVIEVIVVDLKDGNKRTKNQCTTDSNGECRLTAETSGGFFSDSLIKNTFSVQKDGYSKVFKFEEKEIGTTDYAVSLKLTALGSTSGVMTYPLGTGPTLMERTGLQPTDMPDLFASGTVDQTRGKFETYEEYQKRQATTKRRLIAGKIRTNDPQTCNTSYDHSAKKYLVDQCPIFQTDVAVSILKEEGQPLLLSNAFDSRSITRRVEKRYAFKNIDGFIWTAEFELQPREAQALETELMAAVEVEGLSVQGSCTSCLERDASDRRISAIESLGALSDRTTPRLTGWRDRAFKTGVVDDLWIYQASAEKVVRYFVYRKSDKKIIFELPAQ